MSRISGSDVVAKIAFFCFSSGATPAHPEMLALPEPRLLFFGHISHDWLDAALLKTLASKKPDWSWVLVGRNSMPEKEFEGYKNIYYLGEQEFEDLPKYCKASQVGLIPFVDSELTRNCNPLKLPEYVTAGLGVVSTPIPSVSELYPDDAIVTRDPDEFIAACETIMARTHEDRLERSKKMASESWDGRVERILKHIQEDF